MDGLRGAFCKKHTASFHLNFLYFGKRGSLMESCMTVQFMGQNSNGGSQFQHVHSKSQALTFHFPIDLPTHTYADTRGLSLMLPWEVFPVRLWLEL